MAKVSIKALQETTLNNSTSRDAEGVQSRVFFDHPDEPIHMVLYEIAQGASVAIAPQDADWSVYIWTGAVTVSGRELSSGSSLIVEHGASATVTGHDSGTRMLAFYSSQPSATCRAGGHVHLLPDASVPGSVLPGAGGSRGRMHADASCASCRVWLHEITGLQPEGTAAAERTEQGIHAHSEDEIIFITAGSMQFGKRTYGPGTALAIRADTFYSFSPGDEGLSFVNFRAGLPGDIRFKNGRVMDEVAYWRDSVGRPEYING